MLSTSNNYLRIHDLDIDAFSPTWKELLHPLMMPIKSYTPPPSKRNNFDPKPELPCYVHLGKRMAEPTTDFDKKLHVVLDKEGVYLNLDAFNKENIDEMLLKKIWDAMDIKLAADSNTARSNERLKLSASDCLKTVLAKMPTIEFAEHGIMIQTYQIPVIELNSAYYTKRVRDVVNDFLTTTLVGSNYLLKKKIMQVFLYEALNFMPGRLFTKFTAERARYHIEEILKFLTATFHQQDESELIVELLYLEHYGLSPTIYAVLKSSLTKSLCQRPFFKDLALFIQSPWYTSATHGLQRLCRRKILICLIKCHVQFLVKQLRLRTRLTPLEEGKIFHVFLQTCVTALALPKLEMW